MSDEKKFDWSTFGPFFGHPLYDKNVLGLIANFAKPTKFEIVDKYIRGEITLPMARDKFTKLVQLKTSSLKKRRDSVLKMKDVIAYLLDVAHQFTKKDKGSIHDPRVPPCRSPSLDYRRTSDWGETFPDYDTPVIYEDSQGIEIVAVVKVGVIFKMLMPTIRALEDMLNLRKVQIVNDAGETRIMSLHVSTHGFWRPGFLSSNRTRYVSLVLTQDN